MEKYELTLFITLSKSEFEITRRKRKYFIYDEGCHFSKTTANKSIKFLNKNSAAKNDK